MTNHLPSKLIDAQNLCKYFPLPGSKDIVRAVDGVSFEIFRGETLGLVGESGCGKSTIGRLILRLIEPTSGGVMFEEKNIFNLHGLQMRGLRREMQIIFQDPYSSLNPRLRARDIVAEPLVIHGIGNRAARYGRVAALFKQVGLDPDYMNRYPHQFSGGQRQRIGIARALALNPKLIICDEPVSSLDVSVQAQIINLLSDLQKEHGLTYLFISHAMAVVEHISSRVAVMYLGRIVEIASAEELYLTSLHPYTQALLSAVPVPDPGRKRERIILRGDVPTPVNPPRGCHFHTRCLRATLECQSIDPELREVRPGHQVACIHAPGWASAKASGNRNSRDQSFS